MEAPPPRIWPAECFERGEPEPVAPVGVKPALTAPEGVQRDYFEGVQGALIVLLKAWGKTANEKLEACSTAHRQGG